MFGKFSFDMRGMHGNVFERGDFKFIILDLLREKPRHGYEIIREVGERSGGAYSPSPGVVYPTLQMLEDMGYITSVQQEGKKVYSITDEGRRYVEEQEKTSGSPWERAEEHWGHRFHKDFREAMHEFREFGKSMGRRYASPEKMRRIREVIARSRREIEDILTEEEPKEPTP